MMPGCPVDRLTSRSKSYPVKTSPSCLALVRCSNSGGRKYIDPADTGESTEGFTDE